MGKASAIPEHLFKYSDNGTHAAHALQNWVRAVLAPALTAYQHGAAHGTTGVNVNTSAVTARADVVHTELPNAITKAFHTDLDVRQTGNAFCRAGSEGQLWPARSTPWQPGQVSPLMNPLDLDPVIRTTDEELGGVSWRAGARAADELEADPAGTLKTLKLNINDTDFIDGFVDSLSPEQVKYLMKIVFSKDGYGLPEMTGLRTTPNGSSYVLPGEYETLVQPYQKIVFSALTTGIQAMSPGRAKQLLGDVGDGLPRVTPEQFAEIRPDLMAFLTAGARQTIGQLPPKAAGQSPQEYWNDTATKWAVDSGKDLNVLQKYADWVERSADPGSERGMGLGVTIVLEATAGALLLAAPEVGAPAELLLHAGSGAAVYGAEGKITPGLFESVHPQVEEFAEQLGVETPKGEHPTPEQVGERMKTIMQDNARLILAVQAYRAGVVVPSSDGADIANAVRHGNLTPLAKKLRDGDTDWLGNQTIKDGGNLENLVAEVRNQWDSAEPSHD